MTDESQKRPRRTPEQRAAYYQAKANTARAQATKKARALDTRRKVLIGSALMARVAKGQFQVNKVNGRAALASFVRGFLSTSDQAVIDAWAAEEPSKPATVAPQGD